MNAETSAAIALIIITAIVFLLWLYKKWFGPNQQNNEKND